MSCLAISKIFFQEICSKQWKLIVYIFRVYAKLTIFLMLPVPALNTILHN